MDGQLAGKVVIVTGGSRGIGRAVVELLASEGADVTFFYRENEALAREVVDQATASGRQVRAVAVDVTESAACAKAVAAVAERCERIDVLVNNAGIIRDNLFAMLDDDDIRSVLDTNVGGVFNVARAVVPHMISRRSGKIINLSSVAGSKPGRGQSNYAASKGAIDALTRALAVELAPRRITVNAVAPGVIETEMSQAVREMAGDQVKSKILLRRYGTAAEVAQVVWFLASSLSDYMTGQVVYVDGGFRME